MGLTLGLVTSGSKPAAAQFYQVDVQRRQSRSLGPNFTVTPSLIDHQRPSDGSEVRDVGTLNQVGSRPKPARSGY